VVLSRADSVKFTARSLSVAQARKQTAVVRRRGYSLNDQGTTVEHRSVAAPLFQPDGQVVGSVNISVSAQRVSLHELEQRLAPQIVEAASAISATIPPDVQGAGFR
jgi:DNA-binding IclR family transcriptional regulator